MKLSLKMNPSLKKAIKSILLIILLLIPFSCAKFTYPTSRTNWIITGIVNQSNGISVYKAHPLDSTSLDARETWFADTTGAFYLWETIYFGKK